MRPIRKQSEYWADTLHVCSFWVRFHTLRKERKQMVQGAAARILHRPPVLLLSADLRNHMTPPDSAILRFYRMH